MPLFETIVVKISRAFDFLAGLILAATAILIVVNILGRVIINRPVVGTYEMVGFLTAAAVGLALARCALENSHIAISFITDKMPQWLQNVFEVVIGLPSLAFLIFATFNLFVYGSRLAATGVVSSTTRVIFYPFVYLVAIGFAALALTVLLKLIKLAAGGESR
jgi:TRAP-type C4-dicarboxylate transport system permease small subunit